MLPKAQLMNILQHCPSNFVAVPVPGIKTKWCVASVTKNVPHVVAVLSYRTTPPGGHGDLERTKSLLIQQLPFVSDSNSFCGENSEHLT